MHKLYIVYYYIRNIYEWIIYLNNETLLWLIKYIIPYYNKIDFVVIVVLNIIYTQLLKYNGYKNFKFIFDI